MEETLKKSVMEKTLSYEDQVKIKNYLVNIKNCVSSIDQLKNDVYHIIDNINIILNDK